MSKVRLGLIGDNIAASRAPDLHHVAARLCGIDVSYERLVPGDLGLSFDEVVTRAREDGFRGLNITHPYKERILRHVIVEDPAVAAIGACNTVLFGTTSTGLNTDYTGFVAAYRGRFGSISPGAVAMAGSGGAGKAVAFALAELGARSLALFDIDGAKAQGLAKALDRQQSNMKVRCAASLADACDGANGLANCSPKGMIGYGGNAFQDIALAGRAWVFDAVYTPRETPFLRAAAASGLEILGGYELFLHQGILAFELFTGHAPDIFSLRQALQ